MNLLVIAPVLIPLVAAALGFLLRDRPVAQRVLGVLGTGALLAVALALLRQVNAHGIQVMRMGDWPAPYGIVFAVDLLGALMVVVTGIIGFATAIYSLTTIDAARERLGYYPLLQLLLMGVSGAFLTGDLFNLFVWFEVLLISGFVLLSLGATPAQMEGSVKYVVLNLISSALFLAAVGLLYGVVGTLNMADLSVKLADTASPGLIVTLAMLFMVAFGIKAAVFPLYFWLPASYHTPPIAVTAVFAGLLTKVGVYALIRVFTLIFVQDVAFTHTILLAVSGFTMLFGVLGAAAQTEWRRILSFHIVSQIGYMVMGLALFTPLAIAGAVFYIVHHIIVKTNLFLVAGIANRLQGSYDLKKLGGLYAHRPFLSVLFLVPALSLAGIPPLSGFWAKLTVIRAGVDLESWLIVATALVVGLLTVFSMTKIWAEAFWKADPHVRGTEPPRRAPPAKALVTMYLPVVLLAAITVAIGLYAQPLFDMSLRAAEQLLDPTAYVDAVLGPGGGA